MATFSDQSLARMQGVDPRLVRIMEMTRARTGIPFEVSEGLRDAQRQEQMVAQGKSQTRNSRHLTGNALDIYIVGDDGRPVWDFDRYRPIADTAKQVANELGYPGFVWGGDWKTLRDGVHFQLGGGSATQPVNTLASVQGGGAQTAASAAPPMASPDRVNQLAMLLQLMPRFSGQVDPAPFLTGGAV